MERPRTAKSGGNFSQLAGVLLCMLASMAQAQLPPAPGNVAPVGPQMPGAPASVAPSSKPPPTVDQLPIPRRQAEAVQPPAAGVPPPADAASAEDISPLEVLPIDLPSALRLAGNQNGAIMIAYERTLAMMAVRQLAAARALPNLNGGSNFDGHSGNLQQGSGNILNVNRDALYVGAGGNAVGSGTVTVPGVQYNLNLSQSIFALVSSKAAIDQARYLQRVAGNDLQMQVSVAYSNLLRAETRREIVRQIRDDTAEVARVTENFARIGQGRPADAERAATELQRRQADLLLADADISVASARLVDLLNLQNSVQLHTAENWAVPRSIVPDVLPLAELIAISVYWRPELGAQRESIHIAMLQLQAARVLPFSPQILAGYSGGLFGGGSNLITGAASVNGSTPFSPRFGDFGDRTDLDTAMYWSLQAFGVGNMAMIRTARARLGEAELERVVVLNQVRAEVAEAFAAKETYLHTMDLRQQAVESSRLAFEQDFRRTRAAEGRPIEVLDSVRLLYRARLDYLDAIVNYNNAQFQLFTAIGQPPGDLLVRPRNAAPGAGAGPAGAVAPPPDAAVPAPKSGASARPVPATTAAAPWTAPAGKAL